VIHSVFRITRTISIVEPKAQHAQIKSLRKTIDLVRVLQNDIGDDQLGNYDLDNLYNAKKELLLQRVHLQTVPAFQLNPNMITKYSLR